MNDYGYIVPSYDFAPQAGDDSSYPHPVRRWLQLQYAQSSSSGENYPQHNMSSDEAVRHPDPRSLPLDTWPQYDVLSQDIFPSQDTDEAHARDKVLSPLPLDGMQQFFPYQDMVIPPTPPRPQPALPPMPSPYHIAYASLTPNYPSTTLPTPSTSAHLPVPIPYDSPYGLYSPPVSSPGQLSVPSYMDSPGMASVSSYHSFGYPTSPSAASVSTYWTPMTSPMQLGSEFYSPAQAGPSVLPAVSHVPVPTRPAPPPAPPPVPTCTPLLRVPIPQQIKPSSKRDLSAKVHFTSGGAQGIRVKAAANKKVPIETVVDNHDDFVLTAGGDRQIRLVIAWPGYKECGRYIKVKQQDTPILKRGDLAHSVCSLLKSFMDRAAKHGPDSPTRWLIGQNRITIDKLWLLSVSPGTGNKWIAELELEQS
ncbi:hypothetical protein OH77DRAFT_1521207 [Trametes cingulata]|nr:hypothetical protein OH77DRAFT_1521207 [Trametes cingulata]